MVLPAVSCLQSTYKVVILEKRHLFQIRYHLFSVKCQASKTTKENIKLTSLRLRSQDKILGRHFVARCFSD